MAEGTKNYVDFKRGTQAEYDALVVKNPDTLYFITDNGKIYLGEKLVADSLKGVSAGELVDKKLKLTFEDGTTLEVDLSGILTLGTAADEDKIVIIDAAGNVTISDVKLTDVTTDIANLKELHAVIEWGTDSDINTYTEQGVYHFAGKRLNAGDNLPITNVSNGKNGQIAFALINEVQLGEMDGSTSYKGILSQTLFLGNRQGGETKIYTRCVYISNDVPANYEYGVWEEVVTSQMLTVNNIESDLEAVASIGLYTGVNRTNGDVFKMEVINNYAVAGGTNTVLQKMTVVSVDGTSKELQRTKLPTGEWTAWAEVTDDDKQNLVTDAVENNVATFDAAGQVKDSGKKIGTEQFEDVEDTSVQYGIIKTTGIGDDAEYYTDSTDLMMFQTGVTKVYTDKAQTNLFGTVTSDYSSGNYEITKVDGSTVRMYTNGLGYYKISKSANVVATELGVVNYVEPKITDLKTKLDESIAAITVSVSDSDKVLNMTDNVISSTISMSYDSVAKEIKLFGKDAANPISTIDATDFIKDGMVDSASIVYCTIDPDGTHTEVTKETEGAVPCLKIVFNTDAGKEAIHIALSDLVDVYTAGNGLNLENYKFSVKIDADSEAFLTVGENGVKLSGVQTAIDNAKAAIDAYTVNGKAISGNPVLGSEDISRPGETPKTVEETLVELEGAAAGVDGKISNAINALDAEVTSVDGTNVNVKVTQVDGVVTAVNIVKDDTASKAELTAETERATQAEGALAGRLDIVEGDSTTEGSIAKAEADAKAYTDEKVEAARLVWGTIA